MFKIIVMLILALAHKPAQPVGNVYSAWTEDDTIHLMISDNGTPDNLEDDFICDWEDNRDFTVTIYD